MKSWALRKEFKLGDYGYKKVSGCSAALIKENKILMVHEVYHEVYPDNDYWTLPGGGVEDGETFEAAAIREVYEEANFRVRVLRHLFSRKYEVGTENCFLVELVEESNPKLGFDPELPATKQVLKEVAWKPLTDLQNDIQVSKVIKVMGIKI
ncbi:NUDIX domain-containing protein [Paenibacillus sp.]|uniref:NUDIX domain-containing protein n=1 Tax=Paenibacillus sp. TaxID=58172 RepID=UPI002D61604D|nr:NUDIX domain-containing protein [Paenibacillus sp.]HZG55630.1 NUDIX domain-containing protein [Paenibacillus sp.]